MTYRALWILVWICSLTVIHADPRLAWNWESCTEETTGHNQAALSGMLDEAIWLASNARAGIVTRASISIDYQRMWVEMMGDLSVYADDPSGTFHLTSAAFHASEALEAVAGLADGSLIATIYCDDAFLEKTKHPNGTITIVDTINRTRITSTGGWKGCHDVDDYDDPGPAMYTLPPTKVVICPLAWEEFEELTLDRNTIGTQSRVGTKMDDLKYLSGILMHELMHVATDKNFNPSYTGLYVDDQPAQPDPPEDGEDLNDDQAYGWDDCSFLARDDYQDYQAHPDHRKDYQYELPYAPQNADNYRLLAIGLACLPGTAMYSGVGQAPDNTVIDVNLAVLEPVGGDMSDTDTGSDSGSDGSSGDSGSDSHHGSESGSQSP